MGKAEVCTQAPAKINLTLDVLGRRDDGFHELRSIVIGVGLRDVLRCRVRSEPGIRLSCDDASLEKESNLVVRAARLLADRLGIEPALAIDLHKAIPVGGGLGGGSSDAAATLRLCGTLWGGGRAELARLGAELGSDVPLFFSLPSARMSGRGECVESVALGWRGWVVLVSARAAVSTPEVFAAWRPSDAAGGSTDSEAALLSAKSAGDLAPMLYNRLEPAVFRVSPKVAELRDRLNELDCGPMRVSGAGSTLFCIHDTEEAARRAAATIEEHCTDADVHVAKAPVAESPIKEN